jgi:hypothetical protein
MGSLGPVGPVDVSLVPPQPQRAVLHNANDMNKMMRSPERRELIVVGT